MSANRLKFVANNILKLNKEQLESYMMYFKSLQIQKNLNLATKGFGLLLPPKGMRNQR